MPRPKQRTDELRARVLQVAMTTLADEGVVGFTTRKVATEADTSTPAVYELFGDKTGLVREVFFEGFRGLAARLEAYTLSDKTFQSNTLPRIDIRKEQSFDGEAKQNSGSDVRASIAVVVIDVQPNGNLVVAGARSVTVNDETKTLRVSGLVRPLDVTSGNTVGSQQVADARISIMGEGASTRQVTRGPIGELFDVLLWAVWPF